MTKVIAEAIFNKSREIHGEKKMTLDEYIARFPTSGKVFLRYAEAATDPIWSPEHVMKLMNHQGDDSIHPYTCANRHTPEHLDDNNGILVPTVRGWICPFCNYTQATPEDPNNA